MRKSNTHNLLKKVNRPRLAKASLLIEMTVALTLLVALGFIMIRGTLDLTAPRRWIILQNITDAYMSYEQAYAERISFNVMNDTQPVIDIGNPADPSDDTPVASPWPLEANSIAQNVVVGTLPGGNVVTGTITRVRVPDTNNLDTAGGSVAPASIEALNPSEVETWRLQSHLTYDIGGVTYLKSRTVVRSQ